MIRPHRYAWMNRGIMDPQILVPLVRNICLFLPDFLPEVAFRCLPAEADVPPPRSAVLDVWDCGAITVVTVSGPLGSCLNPERSIICVFGRDPASCWETFDLSPQ